MITIQNIHKSFGSQIVFDGASFQMNEGDRLAVVGPNGSGKSTLFRLLMQELSPDSGEIILRRGLTLGYLPQEIQVFSERSVLEETLVPLHESAADESADASVKREVEAKKILSGLGFREGDFGRALRELSGGWAMRVAIARLLVQRPDFLLMDEPTNHLDLESLLWLQNYLVKDKRSLLLISHDRAFVNSLVHGILDLREHKLRKYPGDFDHFIAVREQEDEKRVAAYERQQKEIEEHERFISRFRAQASKAPQVQSRIKMLEKMERIELPPDVKRVKIRFPQPMRSGAKAISLKNVSKSYGETRVYSGLDFEIERGQKMVFVGHNGAGKSTLLKILAGVLPIDSGERVLGHNVQVGYYTQHRIEMLNPERTVLEEAMDTHRLNPDLFVRTVLGTFLFQEDAVFKKVGVLSGGEKSRLALVKLLLDPPNLLLLDEPTTHLDMYSVEALVQALREFSGTICFISHDVYFINSMADHVVHVREGKISVYPGNYEYFQRRQSQLDEDVPVSAVPVASLPKQEPSPVKTSSEDARRLRDGKKLQGRQFRKLNAEIRDLEERLADVNGQTASTFSKSDYQKLMTLDQEIKIIEKELSEKRGQLEQIREAV